MVQDFNHKHYRFTSLLQVQSIDMLFQVHHQAERKMQGSLGGKKTNLGTSKRWNLQGSHLVKFSNAPDKAGQFPPICCCYNLSCRPNLPPMVRKQVLSFDGLSLELQPCKQKTARRQEIQGHLLMAQLIQGRKAKTISSALLKPELEISTVSRPANSKLTWFVYQREVLTKSVRSIENIFGALCSGTISYPNDSFSVSPWKARPAPWKQNQMDNASCVRLSCEPLWGFKTRGRIVLS